MSTNDMRIALYNAPMYKGAQRWIDRVNAMHPYQVFAVYQRFLRQGLLKK